MLRETAADVAVAAGKQRLGDARIVVPERRRECLAPLVQRHGVESQRDVPVQLGVAEAEQVGHAGAAVEGNAQRPDRVPDGDGGDPHRDEGIGRELPGLGERGAPFDELHAEVEDLLEQVVMAVAPAEPRGGGRVEAAVVVGRGELGLQQSNARDQPGQRARRVRAATEADDDDAVARRMVARDEGVAAGDAGRDAHAERAADDPVGQLRGIADAVHVFRGLDDLPRCRIDERLLHLQAAPGRSLGLQVAREPREQLADVGDLRLAAAVVGGRVPVRRQVVLVGPVPGAVGTENNRLGHRSPPGCDVADR